MDLIRESPEEERKDDGAPQLSTAIEERERPIAYLHTMIFIDGARGKIINTGSHKNTYSQFRFKFELKIKDIIFLDLLAICFEVIARTQEHVKMCFKPSTRMEK